MDFSKSVFSTEYSFSSPRAIIRTLSDAFSKQNCDYKNAKKYAVTKTSGKCIWCGDRMYTIGPDKIPRFGSNIHYDHVYPASKMNLFEVGNVAISCTACNLEKSDLLPLEYYDQKKSCGQKVYIEDRDEFKAFLDEFCQPYKEKWPDHYENGTRIIDDDDEFKETFTRLLYNPVDISSSTSRYNLEISVNKEFWGKVVKKAYSTYQPMTAKDVEGRVGYTNEFFQDRFGIETEIESVSVAELSEFLVELVSSKSQSKSEVSKFRMLAKMFSEVISDTLSTFDKDEFYKEIPTYKKLKDSNL